MNTKIKMPLKKEIFDRINRERGLMKTFHVKCSETVYFTVAVEAENEEQARELAHEDINSFEVVSEATSEWDIEEVVNENGWTSEEIAEDEE